MDSWENLILQWINCLWESKDRKITSLEQLEGGDIYHKLINKIKPWNTMEYHGSEMDMVLQFLQDEYPKCSLKNQNQRIKNLTIASLVLCRLSLEPIFHKCLCSNLSADMQIKIKLVLESIYPLGKKVTEEDFFKIFSLQKKPDFESPGLKPRFLLEEFLKSPIMRTVHSDSKIHDQSKQLRKLRADIETLSYEKSELVEDIKAQEKQIKELQNKLHDTLIELKSLRQVNLNFDEVDSSNKKNSGTSLESTYQREVESLESYVAELQNENFQLQNEKILLANEIKAYKEKCSIIKEKNKNNEEAVEALLLQLEKKEEELIELKHRHEELCNYLKEKSKVFLNNLSCELDDKTINELSFNKSEALSSVVEIQLQETRKELITMQNNFQCINSILTVLIEEYDKLKKKFEDPSIREIKLTIGKVFTEDLPKRILFFDLLNNPITPIQKSRDLTLISNKEKHINDLLNQNKKLKTIFIQEGHKRINYKFTCTFHNHFWKKYWDGHLFIFLKVILQELMKLKISVGLKDNLDMSSISVTTYNGFTSNEIYRELLNFVKNNCDIQKLKPKKYSTISIQTDMKNFSSTSVQTDIKNYSSTNMQTDIKEYSSIDMQTDVKEYFSIDIQTDAKEYSSTDMQTDIKEYSSTDMQTDAKEYSSTHMQTDIKEYSSTDMQTDAKECSFKDIQTDIKNYFSTSAQTDVKNYFSTFAQTDVKEHTSVLIQTDKKSSASISIQTEEETEASSFSQDELKSLQTSWVQLFESMQSDPKIHRTLILLEENWNCSLKSLKDVTNNYESQMLPELKKLLTERDEIENRIKDLHMQNLKLLSLHLVSSIQLVSTLTKDSSLKMSTLEDSDSGIAENLVNMFSDMLTDDSLNSTKLILLQKNISDKIVDTKKKIDNFNDLVKTYDEKLNTPVKIKIEKEVKKEEKEDEIPTKISNVDIYRSPEFQNYVKEMHEKYESKLQMMKEKMKLAFNNQVMILKKEHEVALKNKIDLLETKFQNQCLKHTEDLKKYQKHISDLSAQLWNVGDKLIIEKQKREDFNKKFKERNENIENYYSNTANIASVIPPPKPKLDVNTSQLSDITFSSKNNIQHVRGFQIMGNAFSNEDEEGELFDTTYLNDIQRPRESISSVDYDRLSILQIRNSKCKPHLKSSYPAEIQHLPPSLTEDDIKSGNPEDFLNDSLSQSLLTGEKVKRKVRATNNSVTPRRSRRFSNIFRKPKSVPDK